MKPPATASKDVKDAIQKAKEAKKTKKDCKTVCPEALDIVCAHDSADQTFKPRSFGNTCAMEQHNCETGSSK